MYTDEITTILENDDFVGPIFGGCLPSDKLCGLGVVSLPCAYVCNYDPSHLPGTHWVAIYISDDRKGYFFCPFGLEPLSDHIYDFLERNCDEWTMNTRQLQGWDSTSCGQFSIFFLMYKSRGWSMNFIVSLFDNDTSKNDRAVYEFVDNLVS